MKTLTKGLSLVALSVSMATTAQTYSAKHMAQGFTSITHDFTASMSNPALINRYDDNDDVYFALNVGALGSDEYDVIDIGEDVADDIDVLTDDINQLENDIDNGVITDPAELEARRDQLTAQALTITSQLSEIDEKPVEVSAGASMLAIIPNKYLSVGVYANAVGRINASVNYNQGENGNESDSDKLVRAIDNLDECILLGNQDSNCTSSPEEGLLSSGLGLGYTIAEGGLMFGKEIVNHANYDLSIGTKIKYQEIKLVYVNEVVTDFDDDDFDFDDDFADTNGTNFDLGMHVNFGQERNWHFALVVNNLSEQEINFVTDNGQQIDFTLEPTSTAGLSYQNNGFTLSAEVDLTEREGFDALEKPKYASVGAEYDWSEHAQFRLGYRTDMNDVMVDLITAGIGISPWDVFSMDIAAVSGDKDALGVAIQFGLKI